MKKAYWTCSSCKKKVALVGKDFLKSLNEHRKTCSGKMRIQRK